MIGSRQQADEQSCWQLVHVDIGERMLPKEQATTHYFTLVSVLLLLLQVCCSHWEQQP
jgi:hypothetical protein